MKQDLDALKAEILEYLESQDFAVFHGLPRLTENLPAVYWDVNRYPDFRMFLAVARQAEVRLITFHHREFSSGAVDDALDSLEDSDLAAEDRVRLEHRLQDMQAYNGFTCVIELSFDCQGRAYVYDLHTGWYVDFLDTVDEIESYIPEEDEEQDEDAIGGYFSRN